MAIVAWVEQGLIVLCDVWEAEYERITAWTGLWHYSGQVAVIKRKMARMEGFEPPTAWFVARYSIQLSYMRMLRVSLRAWIMGNRLAFVNAGWRIFSSKPSLLYG